MDVDGGRGRPHRPGHVEVVLAVELGVDPPLQADLGGPQRFGLADPLGDLVQGQEIGGAAQVEGQRPFGEGAEPALEGTDVGVVDVAVDHVGDLVAHRVDAELVGHFGHRPHFGPPCSEQGDDGVLVDLLAQGHPGQHLTHGAATAGQGGHGRGLQVRFDEARRGCLATRTPGVIAAQPLGVGGVEDREPHGLGQPPLGVEGELGIEGQPGGQGEPGGLGGGPEPVQGRPSAFGVHVVGGDR